MGNFRGKKKREKRRIEGRKYGKGKKGVGPYTLEGRAKKTHVRERSAGGGKERSEKGYRPERTGIHHGNYD